MSITRINKNSNAHELVSGANLRQENRVIINIWSSAKNKAVPGANVGHAAIETPTCYISLWPGPGEIKDRELSKLERAWRRYFKKRPSSWKASYLEDCVAEGFSEDRCREINYKEEARETEKIVVLLETGLRIISPEDEIPEERLALDAVLPLEATFRLALYGLEVGNVHKEFQNLQRTIKGWSLVGSNFFTRLSNTSVENCASLAYRTLCAGNMYKWVDKISASSQTSSFSTPDKLIPDVMHAKEKELADHAECKGWTFPGESDLLKLQQEYKLEPDTIINKFCTIM